MLTEINSGTIQDYRISRLKTLRNGKPPSRSTLHQEMVCLRQTLKFANRHGWLPSLPDMSAPYRGSSKVSHRAWFSPTEYKALYEAARERAKNPKRERWRTDLLFPKIQRQLFNALLDELDMKHDREGSPRATYSLRHTYISLRLLEGADIYQVAKNCRTSVEMIEKHYAAHIKNMLDAGAINVRRQTPTTGGAARR